MAFHPETRPDSGSWRCFRADAEDKAMLRVIDESGDDYLYQARCFVFVELPPAAERALANHVQP